MKAGGERSQAPCPVTGVLFDLDGTLVDTVGDIALALNQTLTEIGCAAVGAQSVRDLIGRGAPSLITRSLARQGVATDEEGRDRLHDRFVMHYHDLHDSGRSVARAFPGATEALRDLRRSGARLGVVTNKQRSLAVQTLAATGLADYIDLTVGGDSCPERKPAPEPLLYACRSLGIEPAATLMVGDSINDVRAARAAGIAVWCVPYGYNEGEDPRALPCDRFVESLAELPTLLRGRIGAGRDPRPPPLAIRER